MVTEQELMTVFEAAKWAPSAFNSQPWRFVYATQEDLRWHDFLHLLVLFNQEWAKSAWALVIVVSHKNFAKTGEFAITHSYDTGAACQNMTLQGFSMGLGVYPLSGFDYGRARDLLELPDDYAVEVMFAVGRPGPVSVLPEKLQAREVLTSREPLSKIVFREHFRIAE
jgi:nitroreductase